MFGSIGSPEIIVIMLIALLLFGPKKLPEIGRTLGGAVRELKKAAREFTSSIENISADDHDDTNHTSPTDKD
jgi:sec-independent protein translocase protein TatA